MDTNKDLNWQRFKSNYYEFPSLKISIDLSRMNFGDGFPDEMSSHIHEALAAMDELEAGGIANPDENRQVGHYWLRTPELAPGELRIQIKETRARITTFASQIHDAEIKGQAGPFNKMLIIGIGGSALGPQFVAKALGHSSTDKLVPFFFDNTDPDGMDYVLDMIGSELGRTLCIIISKSGGTKETQNGMIVAKAAYEKAGLSFEKHAVAITCAGSKLDLLAESSEWLDVFPMWDWVGGRTSEMSAVGLLPATLQGIDIDQLLAGGRACDDLTRAKSFHSNPAAQLALMWYYAGNGKGEKAMVILPYKDRLELFSKYLQQLIMESLGKELDQNKNIVNQGLTVYGNKGSTDQHAYVQQLRDGLHNFFVTFIEVLKDRNTDDIEVEPGITTGDYLHGFLFGTRDALYEKGRESVTITVNELSPYTIGVLIALYERAVGLYASMININAYHQPGVVAGKEAAERILALKRLAVSYLNRNKGNGLTVTQISEGIGKPQNAEAIFHICEHLTANSGAKVQKKAGNTPFDASYWMT